MAKILSLLDIQTGEAIEAQHVSQSIIAFTGAEAYDITLSGSFVIQGPLTGTPGLINSFTSSYAITASYVENAPASDTASFVTGSNVYGPYGSNSIISSSNAQTASYAVTSSFAQTASYVATSSYTPTLQEVTSAGNTTSQSIQISGSLVISSSNQEQSLQLYGSGSTIFSIEGSRGTLFSIDDDESDGKLFSVNNVSGTPVLEVHEDNTVKIGKQDGFGIVISGSNPLPNDNDAKILITGSIHNVGSTAYFDTNITASGNISSSGYISASSFNSPPSVINQLTASYAISSSYAISASHEIIKEVSSSYADTASFAQSGNGIFSGSFSGSFAGDGSELTAIPASGITGLNLSRIASGSVTASIAPNKGFEVNTNITASANISASGYISASEFIGLVTTAQTASYVDASNIRQPFTNLTSSNLLITGTASINLLHTTYESSSIIFSSGSTKFGDTFDDFHQFTGSISSTGSYVDFTRATGVSGSFSGSFEGEGSGITGVISSSYALTASHAPVAISASYALSSSFSQTASYVENAQTASFVETAQTASYVTLAQTASYVETAQTASYVTLAQTASFVTTSQTASFITGSNVYGPHGSNSVVSSSHAVTASFALTTIDPFPYTGSAVITGSLIVTGSAIVTGTGSFLDGRFTGKVGIGTTTPAQKFEVRGTSRFSGDSFARLEIVPGTTSQLIRTSRTGPRNGQDMIFESVQYSTGGGRFIWRQNESSGTTENMRLNRGLLGIGTSSPSQKLDVAGNIKASGFVSASSFNATPGTINQLTASYAVTASHALNVATPTLQIVTDAGSITTTAITGSNISASGYISASEFVGSITTAKTASYVETAQTASYVTLAQTASYVTTAQTASYILASNIDQPFTDITASGNISASGLIEGNNLKAKNLTNTEVIFAGTDGNLTSDSTFTYNTTTERLTVPNLTTVSFTASFITSSTIETSGSNIFGDDTTDTQTLIGTTKMSGSAQITGSSTLIDGNFTINGGGYFDNKNSSGTQVSRIGQAGANGGEMILSDNSGTAKIALTPTTANFKTNITSSGNISASGVVYAGAGVFGTAGIGMGGLSVEGMAVMSHISSSGDIIANSLDIRGVSGNITSSGNISASGYISASEFVGLITMAQTASYVETAQTASYVLNAVSSSYALSSSFALTASHALDSDPFPYTGSAIITGSLSVEGPTAITGALFVSASKEQIPDGILMRIGDDGVGPKLEFSQSYDGLSGEVDSSVFKIRGNENGNIGINLGVIGSTPEPFISTTANTLSLDTKLLIEKFGSTNIEPQFITRNSHFTWSLYSAASWSIKQYITDYELFQINAAGNVRIGTGSIDTNYLFDVSGSTRLQNNLELIGSLTASSDISASGDVITQKVGIIDGAGIGFGTNFASGNEDSDVQIFTDSAGEINFVKNSNTVLAINSDDTINITSSYLLKSGNISASGYISASSFNSTPGIVNQLTASYAMTASSLDPPVNYKPIVTHTSNFNSDLTYAGRYNIVGGTLAVTVTTGSSPTNLEPGMEWDFFQTSSGDSFTFTQGTGVEIISRNSNKRLAAVGSAGTLKYISGQTFHLIGDLTI